MTVTYDNYLEHYSDKGVEHSITYDDYLEHYGVKGMKWGVRKSDDLTDLSDRKVKKLARKNMDSLRGEVTRRQNDKRWNSTLDEDQYNALSDKSTVFEKNSTFKRVTSNPDFDMNSKLLFVSTNEEDSRNYRTLGSKEHYETILTNTQQLRSPSEKTRVDAYVKLMGEKSIELNNGETIDGREYLKRSGLGDTVNNLSNRQLALNYYGQLSLYQGMRDEPINTAYFNVLKKQGYNSLIDDNDRGILSNEPLMIFDASSNVKTVGVKKLTNRDVHEAMATMKLPETD